MMLQTITDVEISADILQNYFKTLINMFFKILPIRESEEPTLEIYMRSLQAELIGCKALIQAVNNDSMFLSLIAILQYLIDEPDCSVEVVKREVFRAISLCNKLRDRYVGPSKAVEK